MATGRLWGYGNRDSIPPQVPGRSEKDGALAHTFGLLTFVLAAATLAAAATGVWLSIRLANRLEVLDLPNERSSHSVPTPRMGGVPIVAAALVAFGCWIHWAAGDWSIHKWLSCSVLFAAAMAILGFCDDLYSLSAFFRFLVQFVFASILLWVASGLLPAIAVDGWTIPRVVWVIVGATWIVWMLNLYNFMDGIDGLAGGEAAVASCFFFLVFAYYGDVGWAVTNLFIAAASMGFLVHNWPPARVFMGDSGSAFLGAFYGMQSVVAALSTPVPFPVLVLPFANFILDATCTLFRRILGGEKWYQAHRSHVYQRMTDLGMTHGKVTSIELLVVVASCAAAAACIPAGPAVRIALVVSVTVGIACGGIWVRGKERAMKAGQE